MEVKCDRKKYRPEDFDEHFPSGSSSISLDQKPFSVLHGSGTCNVFALKGGIVRRYSGDTNIFVRNRNLGVRFESQGSASVTELKRGKRLDDGLMVHEALEGDTADILLVSQRSGDVKVEFL